MPLTSIPSCDFHIHTKYLGCGNATMEVAAIVQECQRLGVTALGITDHLNSFDRLELHRPIRRDIAPLAVYFGVELNFLSADGGMACNAAIREQYMAFLAVLAEQGACFALGSDAHDLQQLQAIKSAWQVAEQLKLSADRIWQPPGPPLSPPRRL